MFKQEQQIDKKDTTSFAGFLQAFLQPHNSSYLSSVMFRMKNLFFLSIGLLLTTLTAQAQTVPAQTGSQLSQEEAQDALDVHNKIRNDVNVPPLTWSTELAAFAQAWANYLAENGCKMQHRPASGAWAQQYGENIYWAQGRTLLAADASRSWYSEVQDYEHVPIGSPHRGRTGHYTQMVWRKTTTVGIGKATCSNGAVIIVANYDPRGNMRGEMAY